MPSEEQQKRFCKKCGIETERYPPPKGQSTGRCKECAQERGGNYATAYYRANRDTQLAKNRVWRQANKEKVRASQHKHCTTNRERHMLNCVRSRAKRDGIPFSLTESDIFIPKHCPALGIPLIIGGKLGANNASLDRIIPELGYVRGNVVVISAKANTMKNNSSPEELTRVARWARTVYPQWLLTD